MHRSTITGITALAAALLAGACTGIDPEPVEPAPAPAREAAPAQAPVEAPDAIDSGEEVVGDPAPEVEAAIERALAEGWRELHIVDECWAEVGYESVEIFGSGVAIWGQQAQFTLTHDQLRQLLEAFREADFANLAKRYGGRDGTGPLPPVPGGSSRNATRVMCRVGLELDGVSKQVVQLHRGQQSAALRRLALHILDTCREPASTGTTAADLTDGLGKIASGELAPESLEIMLHRKPPPGEEDGEGWLLRLEGREASSRRYRQGEGYADPLVLEIHQDDLAAISQLLAAQRPEALPINLYAEHYTDLKIRVLDRKSSLQARRFADMTPTQHGEAQQRFERILENLKELNGRVLAEGRPAPAE